MTNFSAEELRKMLCENLAALREGKKTAIEANAEAAQVREISRLFNTQMKGLSHMNQQYTEEMAKFLGGSWK